MDYDPMVLESSLPYPKTLNKSVLVARAQEIQEVLLPENAVQKNVVDAVSGYMEVTEAAIGTDGGAEGNAGGEKKRKKRAKNWTEEETGILLKAVPKLKNCISRFDKCAGSEGSWEGIAKEVPGRTGDECRRRMDTLTKSYKAIKEYCDNQRKEFRQLKEDDFGDMKLAKRKLATRLKESWYNQIRDYCPPRSKKKVRNQGGGSPLMTGVDFVSSASTSVLTGSLDKRDRLRLEFRNLDAESSKVLITTPDRVNQSKPRLEAFEVVDYFYNFVH